MEIKWKNRQSGFGRRLTGSLLVFAMTLGLIAATPGLNGAAKAVDFNKACSLTVAPVAPENTDMANDLKKANVVVDLYKVADAEPVSGYDAYTYKFLDGYQELKDVYDSNPDNADWREMAQDAAQYALEKGTPVREAVPVDTEIGELGCGLYLLIARGADVENYKTTVKQEDGSESIATLAYSERYKYTYAPELISLPSKQDVDGNHTTAGNGDWMYSMSVSLKPGQSLRNGPLRIIKTLESYETGDPATFVFRVTARFNGEEVYKNDVEITFTPEDVLGQKSVVLEDKIPVGAEVTIEEIYHGGNDYEQVSISPANGTVTIAPADEANPDNVVSVEFTNRYKDTDHGSGSVTNEFNHTENGWQLRQVYDDGTVVEHGE
ncbi:hypothetical protein C817_01182 [Dorea sp. 5-2]|nr:hypothetical protein C817_01182 [Dorea sp. 5-2]